MVLPAGPIKGAAAGGAAARRGHEAGGGGRGRGSGGLSVAGPGIETASGPAGNGFALGLASDSGWEGAAGGERKKAAGLGWKKQADAGLAVCIQVLHLRPVAVMVAGARCTVPGAGCLPGPSAPALPCLQAVPLFLPATMFLQGHSLGARGRAMNQPAGLLRRGAGGRTGDSLLA